MKEHTVRPEDIRTGDVIVSAEKSNGEPLTGPYPLTVTAVRQGKHDTSRYEYDTACGGRFAVHSGDTVIIGFDSPSQNGDTMNKLTEIITAVMEAGATTTLDRYGNALHVGHRHFYGTEQFVYVNERVCGLIATWDPGVRELFVRTMPGETWSAELAATVRELGVTDLLHSLQERFGGPITNGYTTIHAANLPAHWSR